MGRAFFILLILLTAVSAPAAENRHITDALGRQVAVPSEVERVICSGPGCLRLLTYLRAQDMAVGVDDMEKRRPAFDARPYALAHPEFKKLPLFGEFRGHDNPELIASLNPAPQVILKTYPTMGHDAAELQAKTGIPVVGLEYGDLVNYREQLNHALRTMGRVVGKLERAEEVIDYFDGTIADLHERSGDVADPRRPTCYVGGIAKKGPHGFQSTNPTYPPFVFTNADNVASDPSLTGRARQHANVAKEMLLVWDPEVLFLDLATMQLAGAASGLHELRTDPVYQALSAAGEGRVYGLLPYNWYTKNFGTILANAYFVGKTLYPERFDDVDPAAKADAIYSFLVGEPVFDRMNESFRGMAYRRIQVAE